MLMLASKSSHNAKAFIFGRGSAVRETFFSSSVFALQAQPPAQCTDAPLSTADLHQAAKLARLSGLCYVPSATLPARLAEEGFQLAASGKTSFTRYCKLHEYKCQESICSQVGARCLDAGGTQHMALYSREQVAPRHQQLSKLPAALLQMPFHSSLDILKRQTKRLLFCCVASHGSQRKLRWSSWDKIY